MADKPSNKFFLLSFIPALAYWYLEETQTIQVAVIGGLSLALIEIVLEKIFTKHIHSLSKLNLVILLILGPLSLIGDDGIWFKLQPFFTGLFLFSYLYFQKVKGESLLWTMSKDMNMPQQLPKEVLVELESHLAYFLLVFGIFMGGLAKFAPTSTWAFFKTVGFYIVFALFMFVEMYLLRRKLKKQMEAQQILNMMKSMRPE